jgi:hypothetical protein
MTLKLSERDLKLALEHYLTYKQNAGELYWDRLNSGTLLVANKDDSRRRVQLCREGTADFMVIQGTHYEVSDLFKAVAKSEIVTPEVYFLETKSLTGRQTPAQKEFQAKVEAEGCHYILVRELDQVKEIFG